MLRIMTTNKHLLMHSPVLPCNCSVSIFVEFVILQLSLDVFALVRYQKTVNKKVHCTAEINVPTDTALND